MNAAVANASPLVDIRPMQAADENFVIHSWLKANWDLYASKLPGIDRDAYYRGQQGVIVRALDRPLSEVLVVTPRGDGLTIIAWVCSEKMPHHPETILHFVYVKEAFRDMGIAGLLVRAAGMDPERLVYTHTNKRAAKIMSRRPNSSFNPWLLSR